MPLTSCPLTVLATAALSPSWCTRSKPRFTFWRTKLLPEPISSRCGAEAMEIYRSGRFKLASSPAMQRYLKEHQRDFMPEDTKAGMIQAYLDKYTGSMVCSKQLYKEALNHAFDEPKQWEIREINEIMNQCISGWRYFPNPRMFSEYGRQKGWERENPATDSGNPSEKTMDGFVEVTEQMELPF